MAGRGTTATVVLERAGIPFTVHEYGHDPRHESYGLEASQALGIPPERVFKTLIAAVDGTLVAGVVPVTGQLDLKALAAAAGGKRPRWPRSRRPSGPPGTWPAASPRSASASACRC
jgi:Cys-tRNA(Pro)/Cys-tRNA(Cys) deacylase